MDLPIRLGTTATIDCLNLDNPLGLRGFLLVKVQLFRTEIVGSGDREPQRVQGSLKYLKNRNRLFATARNR
jgi:hypothetical protein